jgi:beta-lactamase regulating signal transducer with metallopeptidase domain
MGDPVRLLLTNAGAAGLIALLAWAASRVVRRHAVVHGLWLLALVKLVTPPIAPLPLLPAWASLHLNLERPSPTVVVIPVPPAADALTPAATPARLEPSTVPLRSSVDPPRAVATTELRAASTMAPGPASSDPRVDWRTAAWALLAAGALGIAALTAWRFARFGRLLACARPAPPSVAERSSALAERIGLRHSPPVLLVPARIPPMLWPARGGPRLLLPEKLTADLRGDELDALLAHELAHVRRRDHWVRLVEIAATALFWWYPVTWWARRALRRVEERCCDEWVLRLLPRSAEAYANGLLKSLTFVAESAVPAVASGLGPVDDIESRLKEILMTRPAPRLAVPLRLALAAAAALGLAVFPTHAQSSAATDDPAAPATATPSATAEAPAPPAPPAPPAQPAPAAKPAAKPAPAPKPARAAKPALAPAPPLAAAPAPPPDVADTPAAALPALAPPAPPSPVTPGPAPAPPPLAPPAPTPVIAPTTGRGDSERREFEEQRRAIDEQRRHMQQKELELAHKQAQLEAQAEETELRAMADRLRAEGKTEDAAHIEEQIQLNARRVELQKKQLQLEAERMAVEAKIEAEMRSRQDRLEAIEEGAAEDARREVKEAERERHLAEQEIRRQHAVQAEMVDAAKRLEGVARAGQVEAVHAATEDLARALARQIEAFERAAAEAPAHKAEFDREIQRLKAALDALRSGTPPRPKASTDPR